MNVININPKLYIKYIDDIKGFGVFTNQKIKKGELIEECYSLCVDKTVKGFDSSTVRPISRSHTELTGTKLPLGSAAAS
jgi:hypothetical protein